MSGTGPLSVIFSGVWQSLQPPKFTRYFPRATRSASVGDFGFFSVAQRINAGEAQKSARPISLRAFMCFFLLSGVSRCPEGLQPARKSGTIARIDKPTSEIVG